MCNVPTIPSICRKWSGGKQQESDNRIRLLKDAGLSDAFSPHSFRATGITNFLERRNRLDGVGAANRFGAGLGQTEMFHLALADQLLDRTGDILDRHVRIDAMLIEKIDHIGFQAL